LERPFSDIVNDLTVVLRVLEGKRPYRPGYHGMAPISDSLWELMKQCWDEQASKRPSIDDACIVMGLAAVLPTQNGAYASNNFAGASRLGSVRDSL
jgi:hypothetical protein